MAAFVDSQDEGRRDLKGIHKEVSTILYQVPVSMRIHILQLTQSYFPRRLGAS